MVSMISGIGIASVRGRGRAIRWCWSSRPLLRGAEVDHMRAAAEGIQARLRAGVGVFEPPKAFEIEFLRAEQDKLRSPAQGLPSSRRESKALIRLRSGSERSEPVREAKAIFVLGRVVVEVEGARSVLRACRRRAGTRSG